MKPDMSTAVMIEIIRSMAANNQMPEEHFLSAVAARIERLLSSESGSSLELNSIRAMIDIPVTESVQAGVAKELTRLNTEILAIRSELSGQQKPEPFMYGIMTPDGRAYLEEMCVSNNPELLESEVDYLNEDDGIAEGESKYSVIPLYAELQSVRTVTHD
ncbi:hypothetical protein BIY26_09365 [Brenneria goodwinii]|uniref:Uncharacterized protein n=1 Tax=Brenneria goodwinii TaxID=1109412 RepID=A0AAE8ETD3_9GAMM|nr:hypothetical protein [Brenneria goodwinii]ATA23508.1 hypothetical protein AWC36_04985 [Brenneria goodwinii]RLM25217.1 hypothetical protein BIY26_09365 [Brenneria goodwinii]